MGVYISKVTSRGQVTLPQDFRQDAGITEEDYVVMKRVGRYLMLGKARLDLDKITAGFEKEAKEKGITKKDLLEELERVREDMYGSRKRKSASS